MLAACELNAELAMLAQVAASTGEHRWVDLAGDRRGTEDRLPLVA